MGIGVDRVDYTKGIPERFRGIERLLEQHPSYRGKLTFVQIGAPSRTRIKRYQDFMTEVEEEAHRINRRFQDGRSGSRLCFSGGITATRRSSRTTGRPTFAW